MPYILTKRDAEIVDSILKYYMDHYGTAFNTQDYNLAYHHVIDKSKLGIDYPSGEEVLAAFGGAKNYLHLLSYAPYKASIKSDDIEVLKTPFTKLFLEEGGFTKIWGREDNERSKLEEVRVSTLNHNKFQKKAIAWTIIIGIAGLCATIIIYMFPKRDTTSKESKGEPQQTIRKDSMIIKSKTSHTNQQQIPIDPLK